MKEAVARTVIRDWEGLHDDDDEEIPYTPMMALEILMNPAFEDLFGDIMEAAEDRSNFRSEEIEDDLGN